ncbi:MAG: methyltransferase domain-containing protein [Microthrixaceae bacterium]
MAPGDAAATTGNEQRRTDERCRCCGGPVEVVLDLGETPVADLLLDSDELGRDEPTFALLVGFCTECALLQLVELLDQDGLYTDDYPYYTSEVPGLVDHFGQSARALLAEMDLGPTSLVVEAASNDGYMLRIFAETGIPVLGVDPASGPAAVATEVGVPTIVDYFSSTLCHRLAETHGPSDLLLGNNVLNLVPDPLDFAEAADRLLKQSGVVVLEVPYLLDTVDAGAFDNFFHQNSSYFSATSLARLFERVGMVLSDVERVDTFGGSLRVTIARGSHHGPRAATLLADEERRGVANAEFYREFARRAAACRRELVGLLDQLHSEGNRIVAYGAAGGMATTLLSYTEIDSMIEYAVDANPHKHGKFTPGSHLEIRPADVLTVDQPDIVLLLAWNYRDAVLEAQSEYRRKGGRFLIPIPHPELV